MRTLVLTSVLLFAGTAYADVIPADYRPPPPPECVPGARPRAHHGRGHGVWAGCVATTCTSDEDCGVTGPCRETALCVGPEEEEILQIGRPGQTPQRFRNANSACPANGACEPGTECQRVLRCIGHLPAPEPEPPSTPTAPSTATPSSAPAPRSAPTAPAPRAERSVRGCAIGRADPDGSAVLAFLVAFALLRRRR